MNGVCSGLTGASSESISRAVWSSSLLSLRLLFGRGHQRFAQSPETKKAAGVQPDRLIKQTRKGFLGVSV